MSDLHIEYPNRIIVDSQEQHPFTFDGIRIDRKDMTASMKKLKDDPANPRTLYHKFETVRRYIGEGLGDYTLEGYENRCNIERKSMDDAHGTILGWADKDGKKDRRARFIRELHNLAEMESGWVVVECTYGELIANAPSHGVKSAKENAKILARQTLAWMNDIRCPWIFCDNRRTAEITCFRILDRFRRNAKKRERHLKSVDRILSEL